MVDSCFEMFKKVRCCTKPTAKSHTKSEESIFKLENNNKHKHVTTVTSFDNNKLPYDKCNTDDDDENNDIDNSIDVEHVHLRRHPRIAYCRSFSTSDALSTDDELMDILCPLPRVNTLERPIIEASTQNNNGR